jgi:hypothetical protein
MKRVAITAKGRVQKGGYRDEVEEIARKLNVTGFIENVKPYFDVFKGEFEYFEINRGEWGEEIVERLDTAGKLLYKSVELGESTLKVAERSAEFGEESVEIGKKMLGKQDETIDAIGGVSERIDRSKEEIVTEISALRDDLRSYMEEKFTRIEHDVEAIKVKIGMV